MIKQLIGAGLLLIIIGIILIVVVYEVPKYKHIKTPMKTYNVINSTGQPTTVPVVLPDLTKINNNQILQEITAMMYIGIISIVIGCLMIVFGVIL